MAAGPESALTPNRQTTISYDVAEYVLVEEASAGLRMFAEVAPLAAALRGADSVYSKNMHFWICGCWTLRPVQFDLSHLALAFPDFVYDVVNEP